MSNSIPERIFIYQSPKTGVLECEWSRVEQPAPYLEYRSAEAVAKEREEMIRELIVCREDLAQLAPQGYSSEPVARIEAFLKKHTTEGGAK